MSSRLCSAVLVVCAALCATACDESLSKLAGPSPNLEPTFASIQSDILEAGGVPCTIRVQRGVEIDAACGQLAGRHQTQAPAMPEK